jgi:hypothetical protein
MLRFSFRLLLGALVAVQTFAPAMAEGWVIADDSCGCAMEVVCCEPIVVECEDCLNCEGTVVEESVAENHDVIVDSCGCEAVDVEATTTDATITEDNKPAPAETKKPEATTTPAPAAATTDKLPPAPIAVPTEPAKTTETELFPGPAVTTPAAQPLVTESPATTTPAIETPAAKPSADTGGLFDEPVTPVAEPDDTSIPFADPPAATTESTPAEVEVTETEGTEGLFVEPSQDSSQEESVKVDAEETVTEETVPEQPASDPLDDLFSPAESTDEPAPKQDETKEEKPAESETFDPFSHNELPTLEIVLADAELRSWSDRQTVEHCQAKLISVTTEGIFVTKASGEMLEINFTDLSDADLNFVRNQVLAQRDLLAPTQLAAH